MYVPCTWPGLILDIVLNLDEAELQQGSAERWLTPEAAGSVAAARQAPGP